MRARAAARFPGCAALEVRRTDGERDNCWVDGWWADENEMAADGVLSLQLPC